MVTHVDSHSCQSRVVCTRKKIPCQLRVEKNLVAVGRGSQTKAHLWAYNLQDPPIYFIFATHFVRVALGAHGISAFRPLRCTRQAFGDTLGMPK